MRPLFQILAKLEDQRTTYFFQSQIQPTGTRFYNLSFDCPKGNNRMYHEHNIEVLEKALMIHWGHLLQEMTVNGIKIKVDPTLPSNKIRMGEVEIVNLESPSIPKMPGLPKLPGLPKI